MRTLTLVGVAAVIAVGTALGDDVDSAMAAFRRAADHDERAEALDEFPRSDPKTAKTLLDIVSKTDWWIRGKIVSLLGRDAFRAQLVESAVKASTWQAREAAVAALGSIAGAADVATLGEALGDKEWRVRRAAVLALGGKPAKEKVDLLLGRMPVEKDRRVLVRLVSVLEGWTGQRWGADHGKWKDWWDAHSGEKLDPKEAEQGKIEFEGLTLRHQTIALHRTDLGVVVLPDYPTRPDYFRPYLDFLGSRAQLHYVRLPDPKGLRLSKNANGTPIYPVDSLVGALEAMRKQFKEERLVLLAHGMSGWLAMAYAQRYPERISALVLIATWPDEDSFLDSARRARKKAKTGKDPDLEALASYNLGETHEWSTSRTVARLGLLAADEDDSILYRILPTFWEDYGEFVIIPDVRQRFREGIPTPALFVYGAQDAYTGEPEFARARKNFPSATSVTFRQSGQLPFLDEPEKFEETVLSFLKRVGLMK